MLVELHIQDFALVEELTISFPAGLMVLTGETGAGKSILVDAIDVLLGERVGTELVRSGASRASLAAVFELADRPEIAHLLEEAGIPPEPDGLLHIAREITREGRNPCRLNGRTCPLSLLRALGERLVDLHGQHEHQALLHSERHQEYLDRFGSPAHQELVARLAAQYQVWQEAGRRLRQLLADEGARQRELDLLRFQLAEIEAAAPQPGEDAELEQEAARLANAERLAAAADEAYRALYEGVAEGMSALDLAARAERGLLAAGQHDPELAKLAEPLAQAADLIRETSRELTAYRESLVFDPARLEQVQARLHLLADLKRKYGGELEAVLAYQERAAGELAAWEQRDVLLAEAEAAREQAEQALAASCRELSGSRQQIAGQIRERLAGELAELGMPDARFEVQLDPAPDPDGLLLEGQRLAVSAVGVDRVEFLFSANRGEPPQPLARIASGGEVSRVMLALKSVLAQADPVPTLAFDEIDSGIGGRTAEAVGRKLQALGRHAQVICVTHLPQIAYRATHHLAVAKQVRGGRTVITVRPLQGQERVEELARMQAGARVTPAVLEHIRQMLAEAAS